VAHGDARHQNGKWIEIKAECTLTTLSRVANNGSRSAHRVEHYPATRQPF
jgi:hypothetical protein